MLLRHPRRHTVQLPVKFKGDHAGEGLLTDLSLGGCRIERTDTHIERRAMLTLSLYPSLEESPLTVDAAVVRWSSDLACGVEFLIIGSEAQQRLERYIAGPVLHGSSTLSH